jgi:hypothetical protein
VKHGQRIQLTETVTALGHTHQQGDQGHIEGYDAMDQTLTLRMDNGRAQFAGTSQVEALDATPGGEQR